MERARSYLKEEEKSLDLWERENWHKVRFSEPKKKKKKKRGLRCH
ncbi:MAG: hypothetical protein U9N48_01635 [Euryarchaeota archaeon]|nr:hypothetical protein [Euryarchaeota archaeon]